MSEHQKSIDQVKARAEENMNALAVRLGELKAHVIRLNALGERLTEKANLDKGEFDFDSPPAQGGPETGGERGESISVPDFLKTLDELSDKIEHSSIQLGVLESMLMNKELHSEVFPSGRPIKRGWISSYFGYRTDPFNGSRRIGQRAIQTCTVTAARLMNPRGY